MNNKDFSKLIESGESIQRKSEKVRFGLDQISKWDRQIKNDVKKKFEQKSRNLNEKSTKSIEKHENEEGGYRDRAAERRKNQDKEQEEFEQIAAQLDIEKSKFLGGDIEHTHLVKGLDYALLQKIREEERKKELLKKQEENEKEKDFENRIKRLNPQTRMGKRLKNILFSKDLDDLSIFNESNISGFQSGILSSFKKIQTNNMEIIDATEEKKNLSSHSKLKKSMTALSLPAKVLSKTFYKFDLSNESQDELPIIISKSKKEIIAGEETINFELDKELLMRIKDLFIHGKMRSKQRRKRKNQNVSSSISDKSVNNPIPDIPKTKISSDFDSIYGDDIVQGKYDPCKDESTTKDQKEIKSDITHDISEEENKKFSFSMIHSTHGKEAESKSISNQKSKEDLMMPVKHLLVAQAKKEKIAHEKSASLSEQKEKSILIEKDAKGKLLVHRDVFATTKEKVVNVDLKSKPGGNALRAFGDYDLFPENADYEIFSEDEEDEQKEKKAKRIKK